MLRRSSNTRAPARAKLVQPVPLPPRAPHGFDPCHVAGEDAPLWLAMSLAVLGTLCAVASASAWQQDRSDAVQAAIIAAPPTQPARQDPGPHLEPPAVQARETPIPSPQPKLEPANAPPGAVNIAAPAIAPATATTLGPAPVPTPDRKPAMSDCFHPLSIAFDRNSARPASNDMRKLLGPLQRWLARHGDAVVLIEGHADATGTEDHNVLLSYVRGKAVASLLKKAGIPARQMTIRAAGPGEAVGDPRAVARDRNAVLRIAGVEDCGDRETATEGP